MGPNRSLLRTEGMSALEAARRDVLAEWDYVRGWLIAAVIVIHVSAELLFNARAGATDQTVALLLNQAARFSVPVFVFISGLLLAYTHRDPGGRAFRYGRFLVRRLRTTGIPYLSWTILSLAALEATRGLTPQAVRDTILLGRGYYDQLYFVPLIFQFYVLAPLFLRLGRTGIGTVACVAANVAFLGGFEAVDVGLWQLPQPWPDLLHAYVQPTFPAWMGYFALGVWIGTRYDRVCARVGRVRGGRLGLGAATGLALVLIDYHAAHRLTGKLYGSIENFMRPAVVLYAVAAAGLLWRGGLARGMVGAPHVAQCSERARRVLRRMGRHAFGIYMVHLAVLNGIIAATPGLFATWWGGCVAAALCLGTSWGIAEAAARVPYGWLLVGWVRRERDMPVNRRPGQAVSA